MTASFSPLPTVAANIHRRHTLSSLTIQFAAWCWLPLKTRRPSFVTLFWKLICAFVAPRPSERWGSTGAHHLFLVLNSFENSWMLNREKRLKRAILHPFLLWIKYDQDQKLNSQSAASRPGTFIAKQAAIKRKQKCQWGGGGGRVRCS